MSDYVFENQYGVLTVQDKATLNEPKSIRFITPEYKEIFRIPDGGQILVNYADGKREAFTCKYLDDYHLLVGYRTFHICEFAETMQRIGAHIEPFPEKHVIWSNRDLDLEDWRETLEENYPEMDDYGLTDMMYQANDDNLPDERANLDIQVGGDILAVADLGRWDGRVIGYKLIESGNIKDCLYTNCDYCEWYVDRDGEFRCDESHHDGTNHIPGSPFLDRELPERKEEPTGQETEPQEKTEASEPETEPNPEYDIHLGTDVYIGQTECSVISLDGDAVELFDGTLIPLEMDKATFYKRVAENPFNDHLKKAVEKTEEVKTIAMTRIGDFYEFFGEDAKTASEVLDLMLTSRMMADGKRVPMCGIPFHVQDKYVKQLTDAGYQVEIHEVLNPEKPKVVEATYNELEEAKRLISDFCKAEYGAEADFSDLEKIGVAYTETPDEGYPIQVNVNLKDYSVERYLDGKCFDREQYASLKELTEKVLRFLDFGELTDVSDEVLEKYNAETESQPSDEPVFRTDDHIFIDTDRKEVSWIYYNPDADAGGQFVWNRLSFTVFKEAYDDFVQNGGDFEDKAQRDAFIDSISETADCELADERTPYIAEARAAFEAEPDLIEFTPEHIKKIADDIENYYAELEAVKAGDAYEAEFGADGTRAFPGNAPGQSVFDRELDILDSILYRLKIDDMELDYKDGTLVATDPENTWTGKEFYEFLVNEAFVFTDEGGVLGISDHLLADFKKLSESYGVPLGDNRTFQMPDLAEAPKEKPVRPTFDAFPVVPMEWRLNYEIDDDNLGVGTPEDRYYANVQAIRLLKKLEAENRHAQDYEQRALAKYVGWGGLASCFEEGNKHYEELKNLLTEEEYNAARESTLTAFFTPPTVIRAIYQALDNIFQ